MWVEYGVADASSWFRPSAIEVQDIMLLVPGFDIIVDAVWMHEASVALHICCSHSIFHHNQREQHWHLQGWQSWGGSGPLGMCCRVCHHCSASLLISGSWYICWYLCKGWDTSRNEGHRDGSSGNPQEIWTWTSQCALSYFFWALLCACNCRLQ